MKRVPFEVMEVPIANLVKNRWNARKHTQEQSRLLELSVEEVGFIGGVIVNKRNMHILDGHLRVQYAMSQGEKTIPCIMIDVDEETEKKIILLLDRVATLGGWDEKLYAELLSLTNIDIKALREQLEETVMEYARRVDKELAQRAYLVPNVYYVVLVFRDELNWAHAQEVFGVQRVVDVVEKSNTKRKSYVVDGDEFLRKNTIVRSE